MAQFSQGFLSSLGRPEMSQSLFGLGAAIGGVPGQMKQRQKEQGFNQLMQQVQAAQGSGDFASMKALSQKMAQTNPQQAAQIMQAAIAGEEKQKIAQEQTQGTRAGAQMLMSELQDYATDETIPEALRQRAGNFLRAAAQAGDRASLLEPRVAELRKLITAPAGQNFAVVGNRVLDRNTGKFISPSEAADELNIKDLKEIVTSESIVKYLKSGDRDMLVPLAGEDEKPEETYVSELQEIDRKLATADKALGLVGEYSPLTYDVAKYIPLTDSRELNNYVETLQSNLAFSRLQKMRDESKTGGALGQVSNIELRLLQSSIAALDPGAANFAEQLKVVRESYQDFKNALLGKPPSGERYITKDGVLYYELDNGTFENLTERSRLEEAVNTDVG